MNGFTTAVLSRPWFAFRVDARPFPADPAMRLLRHIPAFFIGHRFHHRDVAIAVVSTIADEDRAVRPSTTCADAHRLSLALSGRIAWWQLTRHGRIHFLHHLATPHAQARTVDLMAQLAALTLGVGSHLTAPSSAPDRSPSCSTTTAKINSTPLASLPADRSAVLPSTRRRRSAAGLLSIPMRP
jgi:hypothetical protein